MTRNINLKDVMVSEFAKEKVLWTEKMNLKLVKFMESKPNIWNPKHPKYTSVACRNKTYSEFALKYGNAFTGQAVKERWTNIRSTFASYSRKLNASRKKEDDEEYKVNWHLWEACQFLNKVRRTTLTNEHEENKDTYDFTNETHNDNSDEDLPLEDKLNGSKATCRSITDNLLIAFKGIQNDPFGLDNTKHGKIGRAVTKKLSKLNSFQAAKVSTKIMEVLMLYDENNPMNPNNNYNMDIYDTSI